jgi:CMP-N,N'-diacetyllegionaminic acid synthase
MHKNKTFLAIVPARGGSKRLPRKNVLNLHGKPLVTWSINAGLNSKYVDKVVVTSDDDEVLGLAEGAGVLAINRPAELSHDTATTFDTVRHTIENVNYYDYIVLLQPTSPLRTSHHIDEAIELLITLKSDAIISVSEVDHSPLWCNTLPDDKNMNYFLKSKVKNTRSQDLDKYFRLNGAIYICETHSFLKEGSMFLRKNSFAYIMDRISSIDIDEEIDLIIADTLMKNKLE